MPVDPEIVWAAGLFDGEGSVRTSGRYRIVSLTNTDHRMLERFHAAVGVGTMSDRQRVTSPLSRKPQWVWWACAANAVAIAEMLLPWVSDRNRQRLTLLTDLYRADKRGLCEHCNQPFERVHRDARFCSSSCKSKARRARLRVAEQLGAR